MFRSYGYFGEILYKIMSICKKQETASNLILDFKK